MDEEGLKFDRDRLDALVAQAQDDRINKRWGTYDDIISEYNSIKKSLSKFSDRYVWLETLPIIETVSRENRGAYGMTGTGANTEIAKYSEIISKLIPVLRRLGDISLSSSSPIQSGIKNSLDKFKQDYPDKNKVIFVMMQIAKTKTHDDILTTIQNTVMRYGLTAIRADKKDYHEDLFDNVKTYMNGCGSGIAVFETIQDTGFNPSVALETGYMIALGKPVCLLKDNTITALPTDLVGKLYKGFGIRTPENTIPEQLEKWLSDNEIV